MKTTTYAGIDYAGNTGVNRDKATGIRYGVISQHSLNPDSLQTVFDDGRDLTHEAHIAEVKARLRSALSDFFSDSKWGSQKTSKLDDAVQDAFDNIEDSLNDNYQSDGDSSYL